VTRRSARTATARQFAALEWDYEDGDDGDGDAFERFPMGKEHSNMSTERKRIP
jgi:hypothetical protein